MTTPKNTSRAIEALETQLNRSLQDLSEREAEFERLSLEECEQWANWESQGIWQTQVRDHHSARLADSQQRAETLVESSEAELVRVEAKLREWIKKAMRLLETCNQRTAATTPPDQPDL